MLTLFYGYSMMLAVLLGGIAAGSYAVAPFLKRRFDRLLILGCLEGGVAVGACLSFTALEWIPTSCRLSLLVFISVLLHVRLVSRPRRTGTLGGEAPCHRSFSVTHAANAARRRS